MDLVVVLWRVLLFITIDLIVVLWMYFCSHGLGCCPMKDFLFHGLGCRLMEDFVVPMDLVVVLWKILDLIKSWESSRKFNLIMNIACCNFIAHLLGFASSLFCRRG